MSQRTARIFASPGARIGIRRQRGDGYYNRSVTELMPIVLTDFNPSLSGSMSSLGIEVGGGTITEGRSVKESFGPNCQFTGHVRIGALLNLLCALGYKPVTVGTPAAVPVSTVTDTQNARQRNTLEVASTTSLAVGDYVQLGSVSTPANTDGVEVKKIDAILTTGATEVQVITIYGSPTGGTFTLSYNGVSTAALAYDADGAAVQAALTALAGIGSGNATVTGSAGGPYTVTFAGTLATKQVLMIDGDGSTLTGGSGFGANAGLTGKIDSWIDVQCTTEGCGANSLKFHTKMLYVHPVGTAVAKIDPAKPFTTYFWHVQPEDVTDNDGFSVYVEVSNGSENFILSYFDGKASDFSMSFQQGQPATFNCTVKSQDVTVENPGSVTWGTDNSAYTVANTRGNFTFLGDTINAPRSFNLNLQSEIPDDFAMFDYKPKSIVHTGHTISMTTDGKFIKSFSDKVNFNGGGQKTVSDVIPEYPLRFTLQSASVIPGTTTPFGFEINASDVQYGEVAPKFNTNQFVQGGVGMVKIVPSTTSQERWYFKATHLSATDDYSAL